MRRATVVLDVGGTFIRVAHTAEAGHGAGVTLSTDALRQRDPVEFFTATVARYATDARVRPDSVVLGLPASLDATLSRALSSPNIPNLEGLELGRPLTAALGCPVYLERDIVLLTMGEWWAGAARGEASVLGIFFGTGIGGALLQEGRPYRGASGGAGEVGHLPLRFEGRRCGCGNLDCLEAYASGRALEALARGAEVPVAEIFARPGGLERALERFVHDAACGVACAVNLLDPHALVVGGGIPAMPGFPRARFRELVFAQLRRPVPASAVRFAWAALGNRAALDGARWLKQLREQA